MADVERESWTRHDVETCLVAAFAAMPSLPVFVSEARLQSAIVGGAEATSALQWAALLAGDTAARKALWTWARCQATRASFAELCREMGWPRATAEAARRRGAAAIARALNDAGAP